MSLRPFFLDGPAGPLFAVYHPPHTDVEPKGHVLWVPPFAEEMNLSRRMAAMQADHLAAAGVGVLRIDLFGTGDSAGDFGDARWDIWCGDIDAGLDWLEKIEGGPAALWGLRLGGLLAMAVGRTRPNRTPLIVMWQPVARGSHMLTQFLRLRIAAEMGDKSRTDTTASLRERLAAGESVEIAGYNLAPELATAIEGADLESLSPPRGCHVHWLEVASDPNKPLSPAAERIADRWSSDDIRVSTRVVGGEPFWSLQPLYAPILAPDLWSQTVAAWTGAST